MSRAVSSRGGKPITNSCKERSSPSTVLGFFPTPSLNENPIARLKSIRKIVLLRICKEHRRTMKAFA